MIRHTNSIRYAASMLQRKGWTMTEIAEELDCQRNLIVNVLYWEKVQDK